MLSISSRWPSAQEVTLFADDDFTMLTPKEVAECVAAGSDPRVIKAMVQYEQLMEAADLVLNTLRLRGADPVVLGYLDTVFDSFIDPGPPPSAHFSFECYAEVKAQMDQEAVAQISLLQTMTDATWPGRRLEEVVSWVKPGHLREQPSL